MRILIPLVLAACGSTGDTGNPSSGAPVGDSGTETETTTEPSPTHDLDIQPIWEDHCGTSCHIQDNDGGLQLGLDAYDAIVGVASQDVPTLNLIEPGSLEQSYLWHKLDGTHLSVGGAGSSMPRGSVLKKKKKGLIEQWILDGAPR